MLLVQPKCHHPPTKGDGESSRLRRSTKKCCGQGWKNLLSLRATFPSGHPFRGHLSVVGGARAKSEHSQRQNGGRISDVKFTGSSFIWAEYK